MIGSYTDPHYKVESVLREASCHYTLPALPEWVAAKVIYPFGRVVARVVFFERANPQNSVSTYLDAFDALGVMGVPYFELYENLEWGTSRYLLNEEEQMYSAVLTILEARRINPK